MIICFIKLKSTHSHKISLIYCNLKSGVSVHTHPKNKQNNTVFALWCHQWHHTHWLIQTLTEADWSWVCAAELLLQLSWLTFSASMSPIEHVWDTLGQHVYQTQPQPINTAQLPPALTQKLVFFWRSGTLLCPSSWINKAKSFLIHCLYKTAKT